MADLNVTLGEETQNEAESNNNPVVKQEPHNSSEKRHSRQRKNLM